MEAKFIDRAIVSGIRRTADGYAVAEVPVARTGIQDYAGYEVGRFDMARVRMYRPPDAVFADAFLASMAHKPVTDDHPADGVNSANWRELSYGYSGSEIRKDEAGGRIYVPLLLADEDAIQRVEKGEKREVSCGYTCDVEWQSGVTPEGEAFDAIQRPIALNHIALVLKGRAGSSCRVGDSWQPIVNDHKEPIVGVKTITHDGVPIEVTDAAEAVINVLKGKLVDSGEKLADEQSGRIADKTAHDAAIVAKDAEIVALNAKLADATMTPAKLRDAAKVYADTIAKAKALGATVTDAMDADAAMKAVVDAKMGDKAKDYTADQVAVAFNVLTADVKVEDADPLRSAISGGVTTVGDAAGKANDAWEAMRNRMENGYKIEGNA